MPVIGQEIIKRIDLITEGAWVEIIANPTGDDWVQSDEEGNATSYLMAKIIRKWNFTNSDGTDAEITPENVKKALSKFDVGLLSKAVGLDRIMLTDKKKDSSSSTSTKTSEVTPPSNTSS